METIANILELMYDEILHFGNWSQEIQDKFTFNNFIDGTKVPEEGIVIKYHTGEVPGLNPASSKFYGKD